MKRFLAAMLCTASVASASELDRGVGRLVDELELASVRGFGLGEDVAVLVSVDGPANAEARALERTIGGLVRARIAEGGVTSLVELASSRGDVEKLAREAGAEWLLVVRAVLRAGKLELYSELRAIDRGLWSAPPARPAIYATAKTALGADDALKSLAAAEPIAPPIDVEPSPDAVRFDGGPQRIASLSDRVLAMASCDVASPYGDALFVLTRRFLYAYLYSSTGYARKAGALELGTLERAKERVREPFGTLVCSSAGKELALGSSELRDGQIVRVRQNGHELTLGVVRALPGMPLGELAPGKWAVGWSDAGRNRLEQKIELDGAAKTLERPMLELVVDGPTAIGVTDAYRLVRLSEDLAGSTVLGTSGVGISLLDGATPTAIATSSTATTRDRLRLVPLDRAKRDRVSSVELEGAVHATTSARLAPDTRAVIAAAFRDGKTELVAVPLFVPAKKRGAK